MLSGPPGIPVLEFPGTWRRWIPAGNYREFPENSIIFNFYPCFWSSCIFYFRQPTLSNKITVPDSDFIFRVYFSIFSDTTPPEVQNKQLKVTNPWPTFLRQICVIACVSDNLICIHRITNDFEAQSESQSAIDDFSNEGFAVVDDNSMESCSRCRRLYNDKIIASTVVHYIGIETESRNPGFFNLKFWDFQVQIPGFLKNNSF